MTNPTGNALAAAGRQQQLDRERVVRNLHDGGFCVGPESCSICKEVEEAKSRNVGAGCPTFPPNTLDYAPTPVLDTLDRVLQERGSAYGNFSTMAQVAQDIKDVLKEGDSWAKVNALQREALDLIATKLARIVCGDPNHPDSWLDIQGYAKIAHDHLPAAPAMPLGWSDPATP